MTNLNQLHKANNNNKDNKKVELKLAYNHDRQPKDYSFFVNQAFTVTIFILAILMIFTFCKNYQLTKKLQKLNKNINNQ